MSKQYNRRKFIQQLGGGCAGLGATTLLSSLTNLGLMNSAAAANRNIYSSSMGEYKAIVCIMLAGGNDSYNMLVPRGTDEYADYADTRSILAVPRGDLLPINPLNVGTKEFGVHPSMTNIQSMFNDGDVAFIANVGTLAEPTTISAFDNRSANLPLGLYSHADQEQHWNTSVPDNRNTVTGWGGRMADIIQSSNGNQNISMNIGGGIFGNGVQVNPYPISNRGNGSVQFDGSNNNGLYQTLKRQTFDNILDQTYANTLRSAYANTVDNAVLNSVEFSSAINGAPSFNTEFASDNLSQDLRQFARTISVNNTLDFQKQTFFARSRGWDHHQNVVQGHAESLKELDTAIGSFYGALREIGMENNVTTFIVSDFARTLTTNGDGSDHAWGGNVFVVGGAVDGQKIYGDYPDLHLESEREIGRGRFIPSISTDEYFAELALWLGASSSDLDLIFPNINRFWTPTTGASPIGFMGL